MKLPAYPKSKSSGINWLGDIPEHWEVKRLKWSVTGCFNGVWGEEPDGTNDIVCVRVADFNRDTFSVCSDALTLRAVDPLQFEKRKLVRGDLLIEKSGGGEKQLVGCVVYFDHDFDAVCSNFVARMPVDPDLDGRYWCYANAGLYAGKLNYPAIKQTTGIQNLDSSEYLNTRTAYPPILEQQKIAAFLDWKTGQIDALMGKKKELLEKLKEKRIAVITQAVTQGLNPAAPMRHSGIPWLGQVPQHWEVLKMSWVCTSIRDGTHNPPERAPGIHRLLSVRNVQDGRFALLDDDRTMSHEDFAELQRSYTVEENDIVLAIVGATTGKSAIVGRLENVTVQRSLAILRPNRDAVSSSFLHYIIQSPVVQTEISLTVFKYSAQPGIYLDDVGRLPVVKPPHEEQIAIAEWLDAETGTLDALVRKVESVIDCLTEYRTALITAATTGKIDVRKVKIPQNSVSP